jgi:hypothetical protein
MFEPTSRYYNVETAELTAADGRVVPYKRRRFLPQGDALPLLVEVTLNQGDRLDVIAGRTLGDPQQFWRVCDANNAMNPFDLVAEPGSVVRVPVPQFEVPR